MTKPIFSENATDYLVVSYNPELLKDSLFGDRLDAVLEEFRPMTEGGERVFEFIEQDSGQVMIKFQRFTPLRLVIIWSNRREKRMQEVSQELTAA